MPLYEYECTVCKHRFEKLQKFSDKPAKICVRCGAPVQKLLSSPSIQFKGTGWYVTDYGKGSASSEGKKSAAAESAAGKPADKSPDKSPEKSKSSSEGSASKDSPSSSTGTTAKT